MAASSMSLLLALSLLLAAASPLAGCTGMDTGTGTGTEAELSPDYYRYSCPELELAVRSAMDGALVVEPRAGASVLRIFFHDCFVNGCDGSVLLDDAPPAFRGEKSAAPNANSLRSFEVVDAAKAAVESACPGTVSCADVLALAARDAVALLGGPSWAVRLGRRDARNASLAAANNGSNLPAPTSNLTTLVAIFAGKGLSARDMTALSGAHTIGMARCVTFRGRVNSPRGENIDPGFAAQLRRVCPARGGADGALAPLDAGTPDRFDNSFFRALLQRRGLLHADQELFNGGSQDALVREYASNETAFEVDFANAMVKMGNLAPAPGTPLEVRINCHRPN